MLSEIPVCLSRGFVAPSANVEPLEIGYVSLSGEYIAPSETSVSPSEGFTAPSGALVFPSENIEQWEIGEIVIELLS